MRLELSKSVIRSFQVDDAGQLARSANNREIWRNVRDRFPHPYRREDATEFLSAVVASEPETTFAIEVDGAVAGSIGFKLQNDVERVSAEIGYWLAEPFWGRGIVTEAVGAITDWAFRQTFSIDSDEVRLERIFALPYAWNPASGRVLEKVGFVLEGRLRHAAIKDGELVDQLLFAAYRDRWRDDDVSEIQASS